MGDSTMNFHWVDNDALTVEKTVTEKAGDITKAGSGATLDDHIAQANNLMEEQAKSAHSAREQEAEQGKASEVQGPPTREQDFANRVEQKKAEKEHQDKRAFRLKQEKRRMRSARLGSDACLVKEGHGDDFYIQAYRRFSGTAYKWEYQMPAGTMAGLFDAVPSGGSGMAGTAEAGFTAADVIVSGDTL